ncbi:methyltransferase domain-containing protein [Patescibacteria group bacterium]|nr:methyltransferase domain-containing protein [Patescibacteria group bacterium]
MADYYSYNDGKKYTRLEFEQLVAQLLNQARNDSRILTALKMVEGKKVLDLGCHIGIFSNILAENAKDVVAIDSLQEEIEKARIFNQRAEIDYKYGDIFEMNLADNEFDSIVFLEVLEHVSEPERFLKEFLRILKPGGSLIISTPNALSYINILYNLFFFSKKKRLRHIDSLSSEHRNTGTQLDHIYSWDFRTLLRYLLRSGFEYSDHHFAGAYPFGIRIAGRRLNIFGRKEMRFLLPILGPYLTTIVVKVKKPCDV